MNCCILICLVVVDFFAQRHSFFIEVLLFGSSIGGLVIDPCRCCDVCAKVMGELCGGPWNYLGKCDKGLKCLPQTRGMFSSGKCGKHFFLFKTLITIM